MTALNILAVSVIASVVGYAYLKFNALTAKFEELVDKVNDADSREKESRKVILQLENGKQLLERNLRLLQDAVKRLDARRCDMAAPAAALPGKDADGKSSLAEIPGLRTSQELQSRLTLSLNEDVKRCVQDYKDHQQMQELIRSQQSRLYENLSKKNGELIQRACDLERQQANLIDIIGELTQRACDLERQQANLIDIIGGLIQRICYLECTQANQ